MTTQSSLSNLRNLIILVLILLISAYHLLLSNRYSRPFKSATGYQEYQLLYPDEQDHIDANFFDSQTLSMDWLWIKSQELGIIDPHPLENLTLLGLFEYYSNTIYTQYGN